MRSWLVGLALFALPALTGMSAPSLTGGAPRRVVVEIRAMAFHPAVLEVTRGDTVVWINYDIVPHTATASAAGRLQWDTGSLLQGQSGRVIAHRPDTVAYICTFHPVMTGTLIIK